MRASTEQIASQLPPEKQDAFEELVGYPVHGSALTNFRYFLGELGDAQTAIHYDNELKERTRRFNEELAGGKWNRFMSLEPPDTKRRFMRLDTWKPPTFPPKHIHPAPQEIVVDAAQFRQTRTRSGATWEKVGAAAITVSPSTFALGDRDIKTCAPAVEYDLVCLPAGKVRITVHFWPAYPVMPETGLRVAASLDDGPIHMLKCDVEYASPAWGEGVLNNRLEASVEASAKENSPHTLKFFGVDAGVVVSKSLITSLE